MLTFAPSKQGAFCFSTMHSHSARPCHHMQASFPPLYGVYTLQTELRHVRQQQHLVERPAAPSAAEPDAWLNLRTHFPHAEQETAEDLYLHNQAMQIGQEQQAGMAQRQLRSYNRSSSSRKECSPSLQGDQQVQQEEGLEVFQLSAFTYSELVAASNLLCKLYAAIQEQQQDGSRWVMTWNSEHIGAIF
jgi:hypothetical protein